MQKPIEFYSTNMQSPKVNFREALLKGLAPDGGLYMPSHIPKLTKEELASFKGMPYQDIAYRVAHKFLDGQIPDADLKKITDDAYNFEVPLEKVYDRKYIMRLDQGPTASFKDFAARMMGRLMHYFLKKENRSMLILTATSGDTGSAIANAFYGLDSIKVVILYPETEVTDRQRMQMTTLQKNVQIIALDGKFDDCQALVKQAFSDSDLNHLQLSSANSINIGRLLPQSMYYFYAWSQLINSVDEEVVFSVPSGNFGNLMGGLIAKQMGLPVKRFVIATNENDEVPVYFASNEYNLIVPSKNCISSAMNVGHPSNISRIISLYGGIMNEKGFISKEPNIAAMKKDIFAVSISDSETKDILKKVYKEYNVLLEPHGSVAWAGLLKYFESDTSANTKELISVALETAHPAKFPAEINDILGIDPILPKSLEGLESKKEAFDLLENNYAAFKTFLMAKY